MHITSNKAHLLWTESLWRSNENEEDTALLQCTAGSPNVKQNIAFGRATPQLAEKVSYWESYTVLKAAGLLSSYYWKIKFVWILVVSYSSTLGLMIITTIIISDNSPVYLKLNFCTTIGIKLNCNLLFEWPYWAGDNRIGTKIGMKYY